MMDTVPGLGLCPKCGAPKMQVGETVQCLFCVTPETSSGIIVTTEDPGEEKLNQVLSKVGVKATHVPANSIPQKLPGVAEVAKAQKAVEAIESAPVVPASTVEGYIRQA